jgi:hypothetical protein
MTFETVCTHLFRGHRYLECFNVNTNDIVRNSTNKIYIYVKRKTILNILLHADDEVIVETYENYLHK